MADAAPPPPAEEPKPVEPPVVPPVAPPPAKPTTPVVPPDKPADNQIASLVVVGVMVALLGVMALILWRMQKPTPTPGPTPAPVVVPTNDVGKLQAELVRITAELAAAKNMIAGHASELAERDASVAHWQVLFKESCDKVAKLKEELAALKNTPQTEIKQGLQTKKSRVLDELPPEPPPGNSKDT